MQERIDHHHSALTSFHRKRQIAGWMFAIPAVIFLCVFVFYPVLYNVWLSFTNAKRLSSDNLQFAGLKNYIKLFTDKTFAKRFWTEIVWTVTSVIGQIVVGLLFALVISNKHLKGGTVLRTFLLVPYVVPAIVIPWSPGGCSPATMASSACGCKIWACCPTGRLFSRFRSRPWPWSSSSTSGAPTPSPCSSTGRHSVMYEAARVDGANSWQIFWRITLPQLKDTTLILLVLRTVWTATYYDLIQMITGGGPAGATTHLPIMIYQNSFGNPNIAYASAVAVFLGALMFVFVVIYAKKSGAVED